MYGIKHFFPLKRKTEQPTKKMKLGNFFESATKSVSIIQIVFDIAVGKRCKFFLFRPSHRLSYPPL